MGYTANKGNGMSSIPAALSNQVTPASIRTRISRIITTGSLFACPIFPPVSDYLPHHEVCRSVPLRSPLPNICPFHHQVSPPSSSPFKLRLTESTDTHHRVETPRERHFNIPVRDPPLTSPVPNPHALIPHLCRRRSRRIHHRPHSLAPLRRLSGSHRP